MLGANRTLFERGLAMAGSGEPGERGFTIRRRRNMLPNNRLGDRWCSILRQAQGRQSTLRQAQGRQSKVLFCTTVVRGSCPWKRANMANNVRLSLGLRGGRQDGLAGREQSDTLPETRGTRGRYPGFRWMGRGPAGLRKWEQARARPSACAGRHFRIRNSQSTRALSDLYRPVAATKRVER